MRELWVPISGAIAQQKKVETIANNVANANTAGFKRDQLVFKEYLTALDKGHDPIDLPNKEFAPRDFYHSYGAESAKVKVDGSYTDHSQGQLTPTGNHFDFGLHGNGFFEVLSPSGIRYTRQGNFTLDSQGRLVTSQGYPVLSKLTDEQLASQEPPQPEERFITIGNHRPTINLQGEIFVAGNQVNDLSIVEFQDIHALKKQGQNLFINENLSNRIPNNEKNQTAVHQGFIEQSNVNAVREMSDLIKAHRGFESIQRVIQTYDDISSKGVNEISRF